MSHQASDQGSVGQTQGSPMAVTATQDPAHEANDLDGAQSDIIEVDAHSHPSPTAAGPGQPQKAAVTRSPDLFAATDEHEGLPLDNLEQERSNQVVETSSSLSSSISSTNDFINSNELTSASEIHSNQNNVQKNMTVPSTSTTIPPEQGSFSTIKMDLKGQSTDPGTSRNSRQYQLEDGTVVAGKGLGRGRPGVKRGPRTGSSNGNGSGSLTPISATLSTSATPTAAAQLLNRRRRTVSNGSKIKAESPDFESSLSESRDSTPEYNPTDETRSGRKIQKPPTIQPIASESASPAAKRPKLESRNTTTTLSPAVKSHPKIKRRMYRGREQLALCEHCQRGHGPHGNAIVFCDACNRCWHQRCHDPHVPQSIVTDSKAEWFCSNCEKILHGKKGKKGKLNESAAAHAKPPMPQFVGPLIGGAALTQAHKIAFLESRTREQLISLILQGSDLAPALPMFQAPAPQLPQAQFKSNYTTPISSTPGLHTAAAAADGEDEGYDSYFDDHAALYPKPGHGVKLPPDAVDLHMLLEHPQSRTFSHWIRGMPTREFSGNADIVFQR